MHPNKGEELSLPPPSIVFSLAAPSNEELAFGKNVDHTAMYSVAPFPKPQNMSNIVNSTSDVQH